MLKKLFCCVASQPPEEALQKRRPSSMWGNTPRHESVEMSPIAVPPPAAPPPAPAPRPDKGKGRATERRVPPVPQPIDLPPPVRKLGPMAGIYYDYEPYSVLTKKVAPVRGRDMNKPSPLKPLLLPIIVDAKARQHGHATLRAVSHARMPSIEEVLSEAESTVHLLAEQPSRRVPIHRFAPKHRPDVPQDVAAEPPPETAAIAGSLYPPRRNIRLQGLPLPRPDSSALPYLQDRLNLADAPSPPASMPPSSAPTSPSSAPSTPRRPISLLWEHLSEPPDTPPTSPGGSQADDEATDLGLETTVVYGEAY